VQWTRSSTFWHRFVFQAQSNATFRFQSFFRLITVQPFFFASSNGAGVEVPTLDDGSRLSRSGATIVEYQ